MKQIRLFIPVLLLFALSNFQTQAQEKKGKDQVFKIVDTMPVYPGGKDALRNDIAKTIKYPGDAKKNGVSGKVFVSFVVNEEGEIENSKIERGISPSLDKESLRVINLLKTWKPGKQRGETVKVQFTVPIVYALNDSKEKVSNLKTKDTEAVFYVVEKMPVFPGGDEGLRTHLSKEIKYPEKAKKEGIQGKVFISFTVSKDGIIKDAKVKRGVHPALDKEAVRVVNELPKWKPGSQRGQNVNVAFTVPINFALDTTHK